MEYVSTHEACLKIDFYKDVIYQRGNVRAGGVYFWYDDLIYHTGV